MRTTGISIRSLGLRRQEILVLFKCITSSHFRLLALARGLVVDSPRARRCGFSPAHSRAKSRAPSSSQPENGEYLAALALQAEYSGQDSTPLLEEIARLNPRASAPRIRLGLAAELRGDAKQAERWLQEAFSVDRQFETRWTLANFYFRQGKPDEFWTWMRSALEMSYGDRVAAFDLCWQMTNEC